MVIEMDEETEQASGAVDETTNNRMELMAAIMGLGHTIMEHIILDEEGRIRNIGAIDYRIPTRILTDQ